MYCKDIMIERKEVIAVTEDHSLSNALKRMEFYGFRALPVANFGRIMGVIDVFDIYEHLYIRRDADLDQTLVRDVMKTEFAYVHADDFIEVAARLLTQQRVMFLPVMQDDTTDQFLGIIPMARVMQMFMSAAGLYSKGNRITVLLKNEKGELARLSRQLLRAGANIEGLLPIAKMPNQIHDDLVTHVIVKFDGDMERVLLACEDARIPVVTKDRIE